MRWWEGEAGSTESVSNGLTLKPVTLTKGGYEGARTTHYCSELCLQASLLAGYRSYNFDLETRETKAERLLARALELAGGRTDPDSLKSALADAAREDRDNFLFHRPIHMKAHVEWLVRAIGPRRDLIKEAIARTGDLPVT